MNRFRKTIAAIVSVLALSAAVPMNIYADEASEEQNIQASDETTETPTETTTEPEPEPVFHSVTFLDFDGKTIAVLDVREGEAIDYNSVDTSGMRKHLSKYTEQEFSQWNISPETAENDLTIKALYRKATLSFESEPAKHRYFYADGEVDTSGLKVNITVDTQLPETDDKGRFKVSSSTIDISESCAAKPKSLAEAFKDGKTEATIDIIPLGDSKSLASYSIELISDVGDVTRDGKIDAIDASAILRAYADANSDPSKKISEDILKYGDIDDNGIIDASDASFVLRYYVLYSAQKSPDWREIADTK